MITNHIYGWYKLTADRQVKLEQIKDHKQWLGAFVYEGKVFAYKRYIRMWWHTRTIQPSQYVLLCYRWNKFGPGWTETMIGTEDSKIYNGSFVYADLLAYHIPNHADISVIKSVSEAFPIYIAVFSEGMSIGEYYDKLIGVL